ncbi:putative phospholipid-transporting atpase [Anaeramoeba flamelloides]|uniref:Phospholipid-transporting ATPase n=1 Tax=Anaeramoeba flamelloides TaxID=1746091 RepID=A0AAV7ZUR8_9EUKA|nr:putative phospholipid-transporting atpase [Anaeramoeba flamelloides]
MDQREFNIPLIIEDPKLFPFCDNSIKSSHYTAMNFVPKTLFEQFRRIANFYFLIVVILEYLPFSPLTPTVSLAPLVIVLSITAAREAYEDYQRHKSDNEINNRKVLVFRNNEWLPIAWKEIKVSDFVKVQENEFLPVDLLLLSSSNNNGICYIDTRNLDGETNLKIKQAIPETLQYSNTDKLQDFYAEFASELPNNNINGFDGNITFENQEKLSLNQNQLLLRGSTLKNTKWVIGFVVFTGKDTKLFQNSKEAPSKRSSVEIQLNPRLVTLFFFLMCIGTVGGIMSARWEKDWKKKAWYIAIDKESGISQNIIVRGIVGFFSFVIVSNVIVPISLYVSLEVVKFTQSWFINKDMKMYHIETDTPAKARTSNLTEEIGCINHIFSDKTGTLTCNIMNFVKCSINGEIYGDDQIIGGEINDLNRIENNEKEKNQEKRKEKKKKFSDKNLLNDLHKSDEIQSNYIHEFLLTMSLCHTVIIENNLEEIDNYSEIQYQAASPDEGALVNATRELGYTFIGRTPKTITIDIEGERKTYELLNILEFNSSRKRMSVIVKDPEGQIILLMKGADDTIYERLDQKNKQLNSDIIHNQIESFASEGLRTLCFAKKNISEEDYNEWNKLFHKANTLTVDRKKNVEMVCEQIENELFLIGASAIEDKLQKGVPQAISSLSLAGIKIWVLTGDKRGTAINIGHSCSLLTNEMELINITSDILEEYLIEMENANETAFQNNKQYQPMALIISGKALRFALTENQKLTFLKLAQRCQAVICCRVSPIQKSQIVELVRHNVKNSTTLAIGDGANDVSMIQAAHVGVGISGNEGMQAVNASDYSIAQFRFLSRLLLVHGRWCYKRVIKVILYSFYKNVAFSFMQILFGHFSGWSAQTLFPAFLISTYNLFFTSLPILIVGIFDQDISDESEEKYPQLYSCDNQKDDFSFKGYWIWIIEGVFHACVMFFIPILIIGTNIVRHDGKPTAFWVYSIIIYTSVVFVVNLKVAIETTYWTWMHHFTIWGSIIFWFLLISIFSNSLKLSSDLHSIAKEVYTHPICWISLLLVVFICLLPDIAWKYIRRNYFPKDFHIIQEIEKKKAKYQKKIKNLKNLNFSNSVEEHLLNSEQEEKFSKISKMKGDNKYNDNNWDISQESELSILEAHFSSDVDLKEGLKKRKNNKNKTIVLNSSDSSDLFEN